MKKAVIILATAMMCTMTTTAFAANTAAQEGLLPITPAIIAQEDALLDEMLVDENGVIVPEEEIPAVEAPVEELPEVEAPVVEAPVETPDGDAPVVETPEAETPAVEAPAEELPAEEAPVVEIIDEQIPLAPVAQTITIRGVVYNTAGEVAYEATQDIELNVGDTLDLSEYVWTDIGGITFTGDATAVTVAEGMNEIVLNYELADGWFIL